ncbi:acyl-CoA dehydrogenase protein [Teladorsagia circumcincta]|uniref:Acyl-CoA dehydrogenase protein n=1 Tax=Teladorsagia circumcincta TaxID=45464 RepID=A0A2G9ULH7_TELCI|nr:acyl-CoA dehydrogenase protein [Teladorsagia circumcincta]
MNLFRGRAVNEQVFPYPLKLDDDQRETLHMFITPTEKFFEEVNDVVKNDENMQIPMEVLKQFGELGGLGAVVPPEYEGAGMCNVQMAKLAETIGAHDLGFGVVMGAHQSIGYKGILLYGSEEQKNKYLPDLATGRKFAAFCLTEPGSGSDANTPVKMPDGSTKDKVSAFVVERAFGGVTNGPPEKKMGIKGSNTAEVYFDNVKVPVENLLGVEGEGFKVAMNILNNGRFGIPAMCTGAMKYCIQKTVDHVTQRVQFGQTLQEFFNVQVGANDVLRLFVALTGAQHAGRHLQQVAKEMKSGSIGTIFGQVVKRATGGSTGAEFSSVVEPALTESSLKLDDCIKEFGRTVENLLIKYKKDIVNRQYELVRVADAAIDIYCMIATISRCTHSCKKKAASASYEKEITNYFCSIASRRTMHNLKEAAQGNEHDVKLVTSIASAVCKNGGLPQQHPVDV